MLVGLLVFQKDIEASLTKKVEAYLSTMPYGSIEVESLELSVFKHFPNIGLSAKELQFYEGTDSINPQSTNPLIRCEYFDLAFNSWALFIKDQLIVDEINVQNGYLNIFVDANGETNFDRIFNSPKTLSRLNPHARNTISSRNLSTASFFSGFKESSSSDFSYSINEVEIENLKVIYNNNHSEVAADIMINSLKGDIDIKENQYYGNIRSSFLLSKCEPWSIFENETPESIKAKFNFNTESKLLSISGGKLLFNGIDIELDGSYEHLNERTLNIAFDAASNDLPYLTQVLSELGLNKNRQLIKDGDITLKGTVSGALKNNTPEIQLDFGLQNISLAIPNHNASFDNLSFNGYFTNKGGQDLSSSNIEISNIKGSLPGGKISGKLSVLNFKNPYIKSDLNFKLNLKGLDELFKLPGIEDLSGELSFNSLIDGPLLPEKGEQTKAFQWNLDVKDVGAKVTHTQQYVEHLNGQISAKDSLFDVKNLSFNYDEGSFNIAAHVKNFYEYLIENEEAFHADLEINSDQFYTSYLLFNPDLSAAIDDRIYNLKLKTKVELKNNSIKPYAVPDINAYIEQLSFELDSFPGISNITGFFKLRDSTNGLRIDSRDGLLQLNDGAISLDGIVEFKPDYSGMSIDTKHQLQNFPENYIWELVYALSDKDLIDTKSITPENLTRIKGDVEAKYDMVFNPFSMRKAALRSPQLSYTQPEERPYIFNDFDLAIDSLFIGKSSKNSPSGITKIKGYLNTSSYDTPLVKSKASRLSFNGDKESISVNFSSNPEAEEINRGSLVVDLKNELTTYSFNYSIHDLNPKTLLDDYNSSFSLDGNIDADLSINAEGNSWSQLQETVTGNLEISSDSLTLYGIDLDDILAKYENSQNFDLIDVSAFVLAGPVGAVVTKGADFTRLISADMDLSQTTTVPQAYMNWSISDGVLKTKDVAFKTNQNRVAFNGEIDIARDTIPNFSVYVVDKNGCSLMDQSIYGKTDDIQMGKIKIAKTLLGSVINLLNTVVGGDCDIVYNGRVKSD